jgi:hypothetical protein
MKLRYTNQPLLGNANTLTMAGVVGFAPCLEDIYRETSLEFRLPAAPTLVQVLATCPKLLISNWSTLRLLCHSDSFQTSCRRLMNQITFQSPDLSARDLALGSWDTRSLSREERRRLARAVEISSESSVKLLLLTTSLQQTLPSPLFIRGLRHITELVKVPLPHLSPIDAQILPGECGQPLADLVQVLDMPLFPSELCLISEWSKELESVTQAIRASIQPDLARKRTAAIQERAGHYARSLRLIEPAAPDLHKVDVGWIEAYRAAYLSSLLAQTYATLAWFSAALRSFVVTTEYKARKKNAAEEQAFFPRCDTIGRN